MYTFDRDEVNKPQTALHKKLTFLCRNKKEIDLNF